MRPTQAGKPPESRGSGGLFSSRLTTVHYSLPCPHPTTNGADVTRVDEFRVPQPASSPAAWSI